VFEDHVDASLVGDCGGLRPREFFCDLWLIPWFGGRVREPFCNFSSEPAVGNHARAPKNFAIWMAAVPTPAAGTEYEDVFRPGWSLRRGRIRHMPRPFGKTSGDRGGFVRTKDFSGTGKAV